MNLFRSLVLAKQEFCSVVRNFVGVTQTCILVKMQHRLVRIAYDRFIEMRVYFQYETLLNLLGLVPLCKRRQKREIFFFKVANAIIDAPSLLNRISFCYFILGTIIVI